MAERMAKSRSDFNRHASFHTDTTSPLLGRQNSSKITELSNDILGAIEADDHDGVRGALALVPASLTDAVLSPSMMTEYALRTPLMTAAASRDYALFTTILHAVNRSIDRHLDVANQIQAKRRQLEMKDMHGMTLAMIAAWSGNVAILGAVVDVIQAVKDPERLLDADYGAKTVLMYAACSGRCAVFARMFNAIQGNFSWDKVEEQLLLTSADNRTILMHAARCGDQMAALGVVNACKKSIRPGKMRALLKDTDGDGMTFLMHAAAGEKNATWDAPATTAHPAPTAKFGPLDEDTTPPTVVASSSGDGLNPVSEEHEAKDDSSLDEDDGTKHVDVVPTHVPVKHVKSTLRSDTAPAGGKHRKGDIEEVAFIHAEGGIMDPSLVVFKTAWNAVKETLWKEQVHEQLKAKDSWGRTILTHAVLSGSTEVFDTAFYAVSGELRAYEMDRLLEINREDKRETIMEAALAISSKSMVALVSDRDKQVKKSVALHEQASTIEAKIQSFIPGKLIVIFQLLLPEVDHRNDALTLLVALSVIAPLLSWARTLIDQEKPSFDNTQGRSVVSLCLAGPAMFFWGVGTSDIGQRSLGWNATSSAAALAVATIVIPALDGFFGSPSVEQWYDKCSCQRLRFNRKARARWDKENAKRIAAAAAAAAVAVRSSPTARNMQVAPSKHRGDEIGGRHGWTHEADVAAAEHRLSTAEALPRVDANV